MSKDFEPQLVQVDDLFDPDTQEAQEARIRVMGILNSVATSASKPGVSKLLRRASQDVMAQAAQRHFDRKQSA